MKLDCVLTAVNNNKLYIDILPLFIKQWNKLYPNVDVKVILINDKIPDEFIEFNNNIILFKPIENISTAFISQYIRLLYPCIMNYNNGILITDIDDLPMNNTFFTKNIEKFDNEKWINLRDWKIKNKEIAMCWQVATSKTWKEVFKINNLNDIINRIKNVFFSTEYKDGHGELGWNTDQLHLYNYVMDWNKKSNNYIFLKDSETGFNRLNRRNIKRINNKIKKNIQNGYYSDYHCNRPMSKYSVLNYNIYNLL